MLSTFAVAPIVGWVNANQGVVSIAIFVATLLLGWATGIFQALRRRPKFKINVIDGPTFACTFLTGKKHEDVDIHRTGFAIYLKVSNVGSAPSSIDEIHLGYHWSILPFSYDWLRYRVGWFWLTNQVSIMTDFQALLGKNLKVYPFLFQKSHISGASAETYLEIGQSTNGVIYFEQPDSWGGCFPLSREGRVHVQIRVTDAFGRRYQRKLTIPNVTLEYAQKYNPSFGMTISHLRGEIEETESENEGDQVPPDVDLARPQN